MKNLLLISLFIFISIFSSAQNIADYKLGMKLEGADMIHMTIGRVKGVVFLYPNEYGYIYALGFVPSNDGKNPSKVSSQDFDSFFDDIKSKYNTDFKSNIDHTQNKIYYYGKHEGNQIVITCDYEINSPPYLYSMSMMLNKL
ncbi:hypothetical protein [Flammeovirga sp. SJP92]|uniref:hypothetical protein n=1 Tax=Flammeovirga sp. SJP92 TaxID=1775430 RepID=UPI000786D503|nr:hypothetical protein [Flammeovirga sp. SJP92]KXX71944.1 hypothetical protein AVL50_03935 [Flammeovirga sp. SJP92]